MASPNGESKWRVPMASHCDTHPAPGMLTSNHLPWRDQTMDLYKRVVVSLFGDPTKIAQALGLDIELPDVDCVDPAYWERVHTKGWKPQLLGKIADPEFNGDPDWCSLLRLDFAEVRFDLEEGIKFMTELPDLSRVIELLYRLQDAGI